MNRKLVKQVLIGAFVYVSAVMVLEALIYVLSHIPPAAVNLDSVIAPLAWIESALTWSKHVLRALWPGETTPRWLLWGVAGFNWLLWGVLLTFLWRGWRRLRD